MLDEAAIRQHLGDGTLLGPVRALGSVTSTNDIAWAWAAAGCPEGTVFFAEEQVQGRGRFGRRWHCPRGCGVLMSVVFRPAVAAIAPAHLTAIAAVAVAEAIEGVSGLAVSIHWPNDLVVGGLKVAGILVERRGRAAASACVVGAGINVNVAPEEFPEEVRCVATSLSAAAGRRFEREVLAARLLRRLDARYREACEGRWGDVASAWRGCCPLAGQRATLESRGKAFGGTVVAVDPVEGIELELDGGERRVFAAESTSVVHGPPEVERRASALETGGD